MNNPSEPNNAHSPKWRSTAFLREVRDAAKYALDHLSMLLQCLNDPSRADEYERLLRNGQIVGMPIRNRDYRAEFSKEIGGVGLFLSYTPESNARNTLLIKAELRMDEIGDLSADEE